MYSFAHRVFSHKPTSALFSLTLALSYSVSSYAQQQTREELPIEEIIVTAEKTKRRLQDVPSSISVISRDDIELLTGNAVADAVALAPNVTVYNQGGRTSTYFYARGIGRAELNYPIVSVNVNGVALPDPSFFGLDINAAEQVEFLRGPQGTLYGQNTLGGVININLREPGDVFSGNVDAKIGERAMREVIVRMDGPIIDDKLSGALTVLHNDVDGYIENTTTNSTQNDENTIGGSVYLMATPTERLTFKLNYFIQNRDDGLPQYARGDELFEMDNNAETRETVDSNILGLSVAYTADDILFESQTAWVDNQRFTRNDTDMSALSLMESWADIDIDQWSQEFRAIGSFNESWSYVLGLYGTRMHSLFDVFIDDIGAVTGLGHPVRINDAVDFTDTNLAVFGQLNYILGDWEFILGLRYQHQRIETDNFNTIKLLVNGVTDQTLAPRETLNAKQNYNTLLPKFALSYAISNRLKVYSNISRGFRAGGFNATALTASRIGLQLPKNYGPEYTWNYEIGSKWILPYIAGRIDFALFHIQWDDLQAEQLAKGTLFDFRGNAASANSTGFEIDARIFPTENWEVGATLGYADAQYETFIDALSDDDLSGNQIAGGANYTWSAFARYKNKTLWGNKGINASLTTQGVGKRYFDTQNTVKGAPYTLINARVGFTYNSAELYVFSNNLLNKRYIEYHFPAFGRLGGEPRLTGIGFEWHW